MKEFIEKLKSRLEERRNEENNNSLCEMNENGHTLDFECSVGKTNAFNESISIVNELAEEYSADTPQKSVNGWIPCSEGLPEEKGEYLVTLKTGVVTSAIYDSNENKWVDAMEEYFEYPCIAWQPLPQPYKPQESEWKNKVMKHFTNVE